MSITIKIDIESCDQCPYASVSKVFTSDSWEDIRKIYCGKLKEDIYKYLDWHEESPIPQNCPMKM